MPVKDRYCDLPRDKSILLTHPILFHLMPCHAMPCHTIRAVPLQHPREIAGTISRVTALCRQLYGTFLQAQAHGPLLWATRSARRCFVADKQTAGLTVGCQNVDTCRPVA